MELLEWRVFDSIEPIGLARSDYHTAILAYMIAASNRGKRGRKPKLKDFIVDWWKSRATAEPAEMLAMAAELTRAMGGTVAPTVQEAIDAERNRPDDGDPRARFERL